MPNFFLYMGPNGAPGAGSTLHTIEFSCDFMIRCILKLQRERLRSMVVKEAAHKAWMKQVDRYFFKTTFTYTCKSWAKRNIPDGRVMAIWPGSSVHAKICFENPRWEDFDYEYLEPEDDVLAWTGNGLTVAQMEDSKTTQYLDEVDIPPVLCP